MILKGAQRGYGRELAAHLLDGRENDHVEVGSLRGFAAGDLREALIEIEAAARGTYARQPFFSVSFNPPAEADVTAGQFAAAFDAVERKLGLEDQPRAVVFHEKHGRRHAHVIWSRIDTERMKSIRLSHFKRKLGDVSRALYRDLGLSAPPGLADPAQADPLGYGRQAWQQAKRLDEDPRALKALILDLFRQADSASAFAAALEDHALMLARGDRRGFVILHHSGEALPLHRFLGLKAGEVKAKLGDPGRAVTLDQARALLQGRMTAAAERRIADVKARHKAERRPLLRAAAVMRASHREARTALYAAQEARQAAEALIRAERLRAGLSGFWQRLTGRQGRIVRQNAAEARAAAERDEAERHALSRRQLEERRDLAGALARLHERQARERDQARIILGHWLAMDRDSLREEFHDHGLEIRGRKQRWQDARNQARHGRKGTTPVEDRKDDPGPKPEP